MKHRQIKSGDVTTDKGPSNRNNNENRNLEKNKEMTELLDNSGSESNSNNNNDNDGNSSKSKAVFFNENSPTKKEDGLHKSKNNNQYDKFIASQAKIERQKEVDGLDIQLLNLLLKGFDNKRIADTTESPLSTIQRRTRLIFERGFATSKIEPDYKRLGFKKGFLAIRLKGGKIQSTAEGLKRISGVISISANIGAFPITCTIVYKNVTELWNIMSTVQELDNVQEVLWSEEIYNYDSIENIQA